jgi:hypothetical protein
VAKEIGEHFDHRSRRETSILLYLYESQNQLLSHRSTNDTVFLLHIFVVDDRGVEIGVYRGEKKFQDWIDASLAAVNL